MKTQVTSPFAKSLRQAIIAMVCFLGAQWVLNLIYEIFLIGAFKHFPGESLKAIYSLGTLLITAVVAFPLFCIAMKAKPKDLWLLFKTQENKNPFNSSWQYLIIALGTASLPILAQAFLSGIKLMDISMASPLTATDMLVTIILSIILMPLLEEIMFRGVMIKHFLRHGAAVAVVASSLIFALGHLNLINAIVSLPIGFILGYAAIRSGSLCLPLLIHVTTNLYGTVLAPKMMENSTSVLFSAAVGISLVAALAACVLVLVKGATLFSLPKGADF